MSFHAHSEFGHILVEIMDGLNQDVALGLCQVIVKLSDKYSDKATEFVKVLVGLGTAEWFVSCHISLVFSNISGDILYDAK